MATRRLVLLLVLLPLLALGEVPREGHGGEASDGHEESGKDGNDKLQQGREVLAAEVPREGHEVVAAEEGGQESSEEPREGGEEGGEDEDESVEVQVIDASNEGISIMLLGSVTFMMGLFYLVNHRDADMVKYSWQVISNTISIFSAVLLFQAVNGLLESQLLEEASDTVKLVVSFVHFLTWFVGLQFTLAYFSNSLSPNKKDMLEDECAIVECELRLKSYAILMGHAAGFAAINAFGELQQQLPRTSFWPLGVALVAWVFVFVLMMAMDVLRARIAQADDGTVDKFEELWDEGTEETEDDIVGLAVSFLVVQSLRLKVGGALPNAEGEESEEGMSSHPNSQAVQLLLFGTVCVIVEILRMIFIKKQLQRLTPQMRNVVMMTFSWCMFFSCDWWLSYNFFTTNHGMMKEVVLALMVTAIAMSMIFFLDKLADLPMTGESIDKAIRSVVRAYGILVGFSWEKSFDTAVVQVSETFNSVVPEAVTKLVLAVLLVALVVPAWRHFILPTILKYEEMEKEETEHKHGDDEEVGKEGHDLHAPLLPVVSKLSRSSSFLVADKMKPLSVAESLDLQRKCKIYEERIRCLEERNFGLENSLKSFVHELNELQEMADMLKHE